MRIVEITGSCMASIYRITNAAAKQILQIKAIREIKPMLNFINHKLLNYKP
jgi:hypothetical protein